MKFNGWYKEDTVQNKSNVLKEHILSYKGCVTNGNFPQKKKKKKKKNWPWLWKVFRVKTCKR